MSLKRFKVFCTLQVDIHSLGQILFMMLDPKRTRQDLADFKSGKLLTHFGTPGLKQLLNDLTTEDIEARPEAAEIIIRSYAIIDEIRNFQNFEN
jgi:hypothetical protein